MYNQASRDALYESVVYEEYLIKELLEIQGLTFGIVSDSHYTIKDGGDTKIAMCVSDSLATRDNTSHFISKLAPLVMGSAFKILDQVWEWILVENEINPKGIFWSFREKYEKFTNCDLKYPDFLSSDGQLQDVIKGIYTYIWPRRNALVHANWGQLHDQDLQFDFEYKDFTKTPPQSAQINDTFIFADVIAFADFSQQLLTMLVKQSQQTTVRIKVLKILADKIQHCHGAQSFEEKQGVVFKVHRVTKQDTISLDEIRSKLKLAALDRQFYFNLKITDEVKNRTWDLFSEDLLAKNELKLEDL